MKGYAIGILSAVNINQEILHYLREIDSTLEPHEGKFLVHGGVAEYREGLEIGNPIVIEFPTIGHARDWYESDEYARILPLRSRNAQGSILLIEGVPESYLASSFADKIEGAA